MFSPVLRADVVPLSVFGGGVVHFEEDLEELGRRHLERIVAHLYGFSMACGTHANLELNSMGGNECLQTCEHASLSSRESSNLRDWGSMMVSRWGV